MHAFERVVWRPPGANGKDAVAAEDEQPLRAELFSVSQLEQHATSLAGWHDVGPGSHVGRGPDRLLPRLRANERVLREAYELVTKAVKLGRRITPAAEWFLDNERSATLALKHAEHWRAGKGAEPPNAFTFLTMTPNELMAPGR